MTQKQIAERLQVTPQAYSQYERNVRRPDFEMLVQLSEFYGVSLKYLLVGEEETSVSESTVAERFPIRVEALPPDAQKALEEYYLYLRDRYGQST
jgi:transcriptional regulator with XRE-family HTH domain